MLDYRLDKDTALVFVSAWCNPEGEGRAVASIDQIEKVSPEEKQSLLQALTVEWKAAPCPPALADQAFESPVKADFWERPAKKMRRMESEAPPPSQ